MVANCRLQSLVRSIAVSMALALSAPGTGLCQAVPKARLDTMPREYAGPRLLRDLVTDLTAKFGWCISLETGLMFPSQRKLPPELRNSAMNLPAGKLDLTGVLSANYSSARKLIQACLDAYSRQGNQGGYLVRASKGALEVVPDPNSPAVRITGPSLLDWDIEVPGEDRFPQDHFAELCKAVQRSSGVTCRPAMNDFHFDEAYLGSFRKKVRWGCAKTKARTALEDYLSHSMTTLAWHLMCEPRESGDRACFLSLVPLQVEVQTSKGWVRRTKYCDRGWHFPFRRPPPPPNEQ